MVSQEHPDYLDNTSLWKANRDAYKGQKEIKKNTTTYLPMLGYHREAGEAGKEAYATYLNQAVWFDGTYRTVTSSVGLIFRKPPFVQGGESVKKYEEDFTVDNRSLNTAAEELVREEVIQGRVGILVSYPDIDTTDLSQQEVEDQNIHAYSAIYKTESIINWRLEKVKGKVVPTLVVLAEEGIPWNTSDRFYTQTTTQYRVLELDEEGYYKQSLYRTTGDLGSTSNLEPSETYYPRMNGEKLSYIPFFPIAPNGIDWEVARSPIQGITNLNIAHYRNSAIYEAALVITASPTAVLKGYSAETDSKLILGGNNAITLPTDGDAKFLEYEGGGLDSIEKSMNTKKKEMAVLGLRLLSSEQNINEGADTASIHKVGEQASLSSIAHSVSDALTSALKLMVKWDNPDENIDDVKVTLNSDFSPSLLTSNDLNALTVMNKSLIISDREMFDILKRGEIIPADMPFLKHQAELKTSLYYDMVMRSLEDMDSGDDSTKAVDFRRLTKPEDPGNANAAKKPATDAGDEK